MKRALAAAICLSILTAAESRAESIEAVKKAIHAKVSGHRSLQFKSRSVTDMQTPQITMKSTSDLTAEYVRQGDKTLSRVESKTSSDNKIGDMSQKTEAATIDIFDGKHRYTYTESGGQKTATKRNVDPQSEPSPFDAMAGFAMMERHFDLKLLPDETVNGKPAYVFELTMKQMPAGAPVGKSKVYYDKATGISIKSLAYDDKGKVMTSTETTEVKIDPSIPPGRFTFKAPPGVTVQDETTGG